MRPASTRPTTDHSRRDRRRSRRSRVICAVCTLRGRSWEGGCPHPGGGVGRTIPRRRHGGQHLAACAQPDGREIGVRVCWSQPPDRRRPTSGEPHVHHHHRPARSRPLPRPGPRGVSKFYGSGDAAVAALDDVSVDVRRGSVHRHHGPVRLRQVDPAAPARRPRPAHVGRGVPRRHRDHVAQRQGAHAAAPRPDRLHLPVVQPAADADRGGEHRAADADRRAASRTQHWVDSIVETVGLDDRLSPPPGRALRWAAAAGRRGTGPGDPSPRSSSPTSPPAPWTRGPAPSCSGSCAQAVDELGQTVVMVTHDPTAAATPTGSSSSPTVTSSTRCTRPTADAVLDYMKHLGA